MDCQKLQGRFGYNTLYVLFFSCIVTGFYVSGLAYSFTFFRQIPIVGRKQNQKIQNHLLSIRLLSIMRFPCAFCQLHVAENGCERRVFRRACINAEPDLSVSLCHMADSHLFPGAAIF